ncbi:DUF2066 domain-containing protein [Methylotuvimicrobium alcaliphilum]|uniref:DUF2066 domain-containing protein n=1 Tax=Methylotuvimicrobium alcaliphilum (strain DSM 19304 / NCIMB 14124 / VKM B-2133 / 20Z) TaxID=1091494 RepID=G4SUD0_META2|nr:DUF2066 domain-containing protein [Methylotuvimicrobium alcaliphilum]CCE25079.1 exported protein of unknown function [Methylotuvimicrobium alcaliphilum 20Z]
MKSLFRVLAVIVSLCGSIGWAAEVKGLFETEVIAKSQRPEDIEAAIKEAMTIVLQRVLSGSDVLDDPVAKTALAQARFYVKQHQYSLVEKASDASGQARVMRVLFDETRLLSLLSTGRLGIWSEIRPETLLWLVVDEHGKRRFFKPELMPSLEHAISSAAKQQGLPLIFPLLDLEERAQIAVHDVLSAYPEQLLDISGRYDVVSILAGRVVRQADCWQADWAFYFDGGVQQWSNSCDTLHEALLGGMRGVYTRLSHYYGVKPDILERGMMMLNIAGIVGMNDITRVTRHIESLPMVKSVAWRSVRDGFNRYRINYEGDFSVFRHALGSGGVLEPMGSVGLGSDQLSSDELSFRLLPMR